LGLRQRLLCEEGMVHLVAFRACRLLPL
jgi:hypothetical protein